VAESEPTVDNLLSELELRERMIAEESAAKYLAYERIAQLEKKVRELKERLDNAD